MKGQACGPALTVLASQVPELARSKLEVMPVRALHIYREHAATFTVRLASSMTMVDLRGEQISAAETVTWLNDVCLMAPGTLLAVDMGEVTAESGLPSLSWGTRRIDHETAVRSTAGVFERNQAV